MNAPGTYGDEGDRFLESGRTESGRSYKNRILDEVRSLVSDAERLFRQAAETSSDTLSGMRAHFDRRIQRTRDGIDRVRQVIGDEAGERVEAARDVVRENPLRSVAIATATGVIVGVLVVTLLNRRR